MSRRRQCLNCQNYRPDPHDGWKPPPDWPNQKYNLWTLRRHLGENVTWNDGWPGRCLLQPMPVAVRSVHVCGQWQVAAEFLWDWQELGEVHRSQQMVALLEEELKATKKLSLERFHRLQQVRKLQRRGAKAGAGNGAAVAPGDVT